MNKTLLFKVSSILSLLIGVGILIYGMIEYFIMIQGITSPIGIFDRPLLIIYLSFPFLILGFFLFVLGWGKPKQ